MLKIKIACNSIAIHYSPAKVIFAQPVMKYLFIIVAFIGAGYSTCEQTASNKPIRGKLVFRSCASTVIQVLDSAYYKIAQSIWQQSPGTPVYKNVFTAANPCLLSTVAVGSELNFVMAEEKKTIVLYAPCMITLLR